jgi:hypothetical protein
MAGSGSNRRWKQGLFPIDEALLDRLIECHAYGLALDDETCEAGDFADDSDSDALVWHLEEDQQDAEASEDDPLDATCAEADDAHALNMRVLNDYLRRRLIDEPDPIVRTLH